MRNAVCWNPEHVSDIVNIDADFVPDAVFWAVDTETPLPFRQGEGALVEAVSSTELASRFLDPRFTHYQLAIHGPAGVGKSHLIHRLRQHIQGRTDLEILSVRRLETNLRAILEKLVERLPLDRRSHYRQELDKAAPSLASAEVQFATLTDSLARAIQEDLPRDDSGIPHESEAALIGRLPNMLRDPHLRQKKFLQPAEVIPELVDRLFSNRSGKRIEERVVFARNNLPLLGINVQDCSLEAREAISLFSFDSATRVPWVLAILNRNLDRAIAQAQNFSGARLGDLLSEIRGHLKRQGKELILLFEEFARLQGYDAAMLEALLVQGDAELCNVRWAIACTSGRFRELPDTVRSRMNAVVDMETEPAPFELAKFTGRYLNAIRLGRAALDDAFSHEPRELPNACGSCEHSVSCHGAFGTTDEGFGLYPFNQSAIRVMARTSGAETDDRFNPRTFQKAVLRQILTDGADAIRANNFPNKLLLDKLGGPTLDAFEQGRLQEKAGHQFDRYLALVELWNDRRLSDLPDSLLASFGLRPLGGLGAPGETEAGQRAAVQKSTPPAIRTQQRPAAVPAADPELRQLNQWANGGVLEERLAQMLRELLFELVDDAIDWDSIGLLPSTFAGKNKAFQVRSIKFVRQETSGGQGGKVRLELPLTQDDSAFIRTAQALQALLLFRRTRNWEQAKGTEGLAAVLELAESCAAEVVSQISQLRGDQTAWDPIGGAVDLVILGSALAGHLTASSTTDEAIMDAIFKQIPPDCSFSEDGLIRLYKRLHKDREDLQNLLRAHATGAKGGASGRFLNPISLHEALRAFRYRKWQLNRSPQKLDEPYDKVGELYEYAVANLRESLEHERHTRLQWLQRIEQAFGAVANRQAIVDAVECTIGSVAAGGLSVRKDLIETLNNRVKDFNSVQFVAATEAVRRIQDADPPEAELPTYGRLHRPAVETSGALIDAWEAVLNKAEDEVEMRRREYGVEEASVEAGRTIEALTGIADQIRSLDLQNVDA